MRAKKLFIGALALALASAGPPTWAILGVGDVVFDPRNYVEALHQVSAWREQLVRMQSQLEQQKALFNSLNGVRGVSQLVNNPALRHYLPGNYQALISGGYGSTASIKAANSLFDLRRTSLDPNSTAVKDFDASRTRAAAHQAAAQDAYAEADRRFRDLQILLDRMAQASDPKTLAELQTRINAEQVMQQNEQTKLQMLTQLQHTQDALALQRAKEAGMAATRGTIPATWDIAN